MPTDATSGKGIPDVTAYDLTNLDVLVVEQHATMRSLMRTVLRELGILGVRDTSDPMTAFDMHIQAPADLILTDWSPGLDGMDLLRRLRTEDESPDPCVPVIVVTANTELTHVCAARDLGMTEYLAKPISASLIYSRIRSVIERRRLFIRSTDFFGPDRRRRHVEFVGDERRTHANRDNEDRRKEDLPFDGPEKRQGYPGFVADEGRADDR
jgi:DNA-binding response OmpR family regulator